MDQGFFGKQFEEIGGGSPFKWSLKAKWKRLMLFRNQCGELQAMRTSQSVFWAGLLACSLLAFVSCGLLYFSKGWSATISSGCSIGLWALLAYVFWISLKRSEGHIEQQKVEILAMLAKLRQDLALCEDLVKPNGANRKYDEATDPLTVLWALRALVGSVPPAEIKNPFGAKEHKSAEYEAARKGLEATQHFGIVPEEITLQELARAETPALVETEEKVHGK